MQSTRGSHNHQTSLRLRDCRANCPKGAGRVRAGRARQARQTVKRRAKEGTIPFRHVSRLRFAAPNVRVPTGALQQACRRLDKRLTQAPSHAAASVTMSPLLLELLELLRCDPTPRNASAPRCIAARPLANKRYINMPSILQHREPVTQRLHSSPSTAGWLPRKLPLTWTQRAP